MEAERLSLMQDESRLQVNLEIALGLSSLSSKCVLQLSVSALWRVCFALRERLMANWFRSKQVEGRSPVSDFYFFARLSRHIMCFFFSGSIFGDIFTDFIS